jgi:hypothetical protein
VTGVFFGREFVSVTAGPGVSWAALKPQVVAMLLDHFVPGVPPFAAGDAGGIAIPAAPTTISVTSGRRRCCRADPQLSKPGPPGGRQ